MLRQLKIFPDSVSRILVSARNSGPVSMQNLSRSEPSAAAPPGFPQGRHHRVHGQGKICLRAKVLLSDKVLQSGVTLLIPKTTRSLTVSQIRFPSGVSTPRPLLIRSVG